MYIEELNRELDGRMLDIWRGHDIDGKPIDMAEAGMEQYRDLWRRQAKLSTSKGEIAPVRKPCNCKCKDRPTR